MAEEKKPKIDLKARLQKTQGIPAAAAPAPAPVPGGPVSIPGPPASVASGLPAPARPASIPAPALPGAAAAGGAAAETLGSLSRGMGTGPFRPQTAEPAPPPKPQVIEIDDTTVQAARKGALKTAMGAAVALSLLFGGVGYVIGGARTNAAGREVALKDATDLANNVAAAKGSLEQLKGKLESARDGLVKEGKFPESLSVELGGLNIDFDGTQLAGRRFSGFSTSSVQQLVSFVTSVQELNDKKTALARNLDALKGPLSERLKNAREQKTVLTHVVVLDGEFGILASLAAPISASNPSEFPKDLTITDPFTRKNSELPRYTGGNVKSVAIPVVPKTVEAAFPSEASAGATRLAVLIGGLIEEIEGEKGVEGVISDTKAGLVERATKLEKSLRDIK